MRNRLVGDRWGWVAAEVARGLFWLKACSSPFQAPRSLLHSQPFPLLTWAFLTVRTLTCVTTLDSSSYHVCLGKWRLDMAHHPFKSERAWGIGVRPLSSPVVGSHDCPGSPAPLCSGEASVSWPQTTPFWLIRLPFWPLNSMAASVSLSQSS